MAIASDSRIFKEIRAPTVGGLSEAQISEIVDCINQSPIFERRIRTFEAAHGILRFETADRNYFWVEQGLPVVYISPATGNTDGANANVQVIAQVLAHELSHFETYFPATGINPNNQPDENSAGALGVRDEARAYALEVLVQREIIASGGTVDWLQPDQESAADHGMAKLPPTAGEIDRLDAATLSLLEWAANWTNDPSAGGYYQYYQNSWLRVRDPNRSVVVSEVKFHCNARGEIVEVEFTDAQEGRRVANVSPPVGRLVA